MQVTLENVKLKLIERVSFTSKEDNQQVTFYYLTFTDPESFDKVVLTSSEPWNEYEDKTVDVLLDLAYSEFDGKKSTKLKVANMQERN